MARRGLPNRVCRVKVLLIGPPGSGKGTQGGRLAERLGVAHLAAGDLLRAEVTAGTPLGQQVRELIDRGELVPDVVVLGLLLPKVLQAAAAGGYILDGFPRSVEQAREARKLADQVDAGPEAVVYLDVPRPELVRRILERAKVQGRTDDTEETAQNRLRVFDEATRPLVDYYSDRRLLHVIDAAPEADAVTAAILSALRA
jgi:adenylate kinase